MDPELVADLDRRFEAARIQAGAQIDGAKAELNARIEGVGTELNARIDGVRTELLERIDTSAAETRRQVGVWIEGLGAKIQLLAESIVTVDEKHDRSHAGLRTETKGLDRRVTRLEARMPRPRKRPGKRRRP